MSDIVSPGAEAQLGRNSLVSVAMADSDNLDPTYYCPVDVIRTIAGVVYVIRDKLNPEAVVQVYHHVFKISVLYHTRPPRNEVHGRTCGTQVRQAIPQRLSDKSAQLRIGFVGVFADRSKPQRIKRYDQSRGPSSNATRLIASTGTTETFMPRIVWIVQP
jgi:hypothetical protein